MIYKWCLVLVIRQVSGIYVGVGSADATGPMSDLVMMGMAKPSQTGKGLWTRLYARAVIMCDEDMRRAVFVSIDGGMVGHVLKKRAIEKANLTAYYTMNNTIVSGTHTHSGASGFLQHEIFQLAGSGWVPDTVDAMSNGIAKAIQLAHADLEGRLLKSSKVTAKLAVSELHNASISRSPSAYLANPDRDEYEGDVDADFFLLAFRDEKDQTAIGVVNWWACHPTSMNNTNHLVSSDNRGLASYLMERRFTNKKAEKIVAAFASSNLGDISPNILGPHCLDTGLPCDFNTSTCPASLGPFHLMRNEQCAAQGPGTDMFESTAIIAERQLDLATTMYDDFLSNENKNDWLDLSAAQVQIRHTYLKMPGLEVKDWQDPNTTLGILCSPALGQSFAAGTTDGPGAFDFAQSRTSRNPLWKYVADVLVGNLTIADELRACQAPKAVLIPTGDMHRPYPWAPTILPLQLLKLGSFILAAVPTELTTMAGRRLKKMLKSIFADLNNEDVTVAIAGLSNEYADYTTTFEEYQVQRYEAGSTIYGPYQLDAFLYEFSMLARAMIKNQTVQIGPEPEDFSYSLDMWPWLKLEFERTESAPKKASFGDIISESFASQPSVTPGDTVLVSFVGGSLNHDRKTDSTYFEVQRANASTWTTLFLDSDPETRITSTHNKNPNYREIEIRFDVPLDSTPGNYRIIYHGNAKVHDHIVKHSVISFDGVSNNFTIVPQ